MLDDVAVQKLFESAWLGVSVVFTYLFLKYESKRLRIDSKNIPVIATCFGSLISIFVSILYFNAVLMISVSLMVSWLTLIRIKDMNI